MQDLLSIYKEGKLVVNVIGAGYVGAMTAITMACRNPSVSFIVCDINA
jgi:UDP-N-acetyl-D-mannosaminuronate dehydrogenase